MGEEAHASGKRPRRKQRRGEPVAPATTPRDGACPIAGIGASAGGLEVFSRILRALPEDVGMALVLVQHLDPTQGSMLADILGRQSKFAVVEAEDGMAVEADRAYVIPAGVMMTVRDGAIRLVERPKPPVQVLLVDTLLRSIAEECGDRSVGIVLSGTGSDGVVGLGAVKEAGGLTFAQDPRSAEYVGMPQASIDAGVVDAVLDPERIAEQLVRLGTHRHLTPPSPTAGDAMPDVDETSLGEILSLLRSATGLDFTQYRRTSLLRRMSRRMLLEGIPSIEAYLERLRERPSEVELLYRDILVNMTEFFRDADALEALKRKVFPEILDRATDRPVRIWVPGCSKGQEAYSILITLVESLESASVRRDIQMFASDVNELDVEFARAGVYPQGIASEVSPERLARFFVPVPGGYQIDRAIREMCVFAVHDVTKDPPFSKLDLITFRNVLIYMERPLQKRVLQVLHYSLEPGGFLLLGSSETTGAESTLFSVVDKKHRIYKRKPGPGKLLSLATPASARQPLPPKGAAGERASAFDVFAEAEKVVRGSYQLPAVLLSSDLDILQFRGHVGPFLDPAEGPPELKLPRLLAPGLSTGVEAAIREAAMTRATAKRRGAVLSGDGERREVDVEAVPIAGPAGESYYLVLFKEQSREADQTRRRPGQDEVATDDTERLRTELDEAREQLGMVVFEREAANSDLRAASERLQSSNEELRTINEEFQTAQEELQSTNEELTTLNDELRSRNMELSRLADDLQNVIEGVEIPILILDADLRIRRYTPEAQAIVSIVPTDVGRPVTDLSLKVAVPDFKDRVRQVLQEGTPTQFEVRSREGRWYSMRIRPYRTGDGGTNGVVVAFIDVDELTHTAEIADFARMHAEAVVGTVREPLLTLESDLRVREANDAFYQTFAVTEEETIGRFLCDLGDGQWDFPELRSLLEQVLPGDHEFANLVVEREFPRVGRRVMRLYARRVREEHGQPSILLAVDDITDVTSRERLSMVLNDVSIAFSSALEFDEILQRVLKRSAEALGARSAAVLVQQNRLWMVKSAYGLPHTRLEQVLDEQGLPIGVVSPQTGAPVLLDGEDAARFISVLGVEDEVGSVLVVPMLYREEEAGFLSLHFRSASESISDAETDFVRRLGTLLALAFENAKLYATQREIADTLQAALLTVPRRIPGIDFGYLYRSAAAQAAVGGDFYDLFELDRGRVGVLLGDVSGKGVQAATLTALVKNTIRAFAYENDSPAAVIAKANSVIFKATPTSLFVTIMFCILDPATGRMTYCSAGHTRGIVKKASEAVIELLGVGSPLAGAFEAIEFEDGATTLEKDDVLVLYTDGVTEARRDGDLLGETRLVEFLETMEWTAPRQVPEKIFAEVMRYTGGELADDVAIVAVARSNKG